MVQIISLGSSCDTANNLKRIGVNNVNFFFDFVWNEFDGLKTVCEIIENNFSYLEDINNYGKTTTHPILNWAEFNINNYYPNFVFMHHDTTKQEIIDSLKRKINRTKDVLSSEEKKIFIYYRHNYCKSTPRSNLEIIIKESLDFCEMYKNKYNQNFYLISLVTYDVNTDENIIGKNLLTLKEHENEYIKFNFVYRRNDENSELNNKSIESWNHLFQTYQISST
jgi:hypothetical protein